MFIGGGRQMTGYGGSVVDLLYFFRNSVRIGQSLATVKVTADTSDLPPRDQVVVDQCKLSIGLYEAPGACTVDRSNHRLRHSGLKHRNETGWCTEYRIGQSNWTSIRLYEAPAGEPCLGAVHRVTCLSEVRCLSYAQRIGRANHQPGRDSE